MRGSGSGVEGADVMQRAVKAGLAFRNGRVNRSFVAIALCSLV